MQRVLEAIALDAKNPRKLIVQLFSKSSGQGGGATSLLAAVPSLEPTSLKMWNKEFSSVLTSAMTLPPPPPPIF